MNIPLSLQPLINEITLLDQPQQMGQQITLLREAIRRVEDGEGDRVLWGDLQNDLGNALQFNPLGDRAQNLEEAITAFRASLEVSTRQDFPFEWAMTQNNLGIVYCNRIRGDQAQNLEEAIAAFRASLEVRTRQDFPVEWATTQNNLGNAYRDRIRGDRAQNLEEAITAFRASLEVYTHQDFLVQWATTQNNLGTAYSNRIRGDRAQNLEEAIAAYRASLQILTHQDFPIDWAATQNNLGNAYNDRIRGDQAQNLEEAIAAYRASLEVRTRQDFPIDWAETQNNLGNAYSDRIQEDRAKNLEKAIVAYRASLEVRTRQDFPIDWAETQNNLGTALQNRIQGDQAQNLEEAIAAFRASLEVYTRQDFPADFRGTQDNLAQLFEAENRWNDAWTALDAVRTAQRELLDLATDAASLAATIARQADQQYGWRAARAALHLSPPDAAQAVIALEESRAQAMRVALDQDALDLGRIADPAATERARAFLTARDTWRDAQRTLTLPIPATLNDEEQRQVLAQRTVTYTAARYAFEAARDAIRAQDNPDFLAPMLTIDAVAAAVPAPDAALVYLCAGYEGDTGFALIVTRTGAGSAQITPITLPALTGEALSVLRETSAPDDDRPTGGFAQAQMSGWAFANLRTWGASGREALGILPLTSGFAVALLRLQGSWAGHPTKMALLETPFDRLSPTQQSDLDEAFSQTLLEVELERVTIVLCPLGVTALATELQGLGIRQVALVPYGTLALLPLLATLVATPQGDRRFGDLFETTITPSARALTVARERAQKAERARQTGTRPAILAAGNPLPLPWGRDPAAPRIDKGNLAHAQAEAESARRLATTTFHYPADQVLCYTLDQATREHLLSGLPRAWFAHLAMHGAYDQADPRRSRVILSGDATVPEAQRTLTLGEMLDGTVNLRGLRLVVLSACETNIIDTRGEANEVIGLAAGMQQAGAAGVIASLWAVDDRATYLLMTRFLQYWLDPDRHWSPARCLATAQRWLREKATNRVLEFYDPLVRLPLDEDAPAPDVATLPTLIRRPAPATAAPEPETALIGARRRSTRYTHTAVWERIREQAGKGAPDDLPYAHPYYWAAFTVTGC